VLPWADMLRAFSAGSFGVVTRRRNAGVFSTSPPGTKLEDDPARAFTPSPARHLNSGNTGGGPAPSAFQSGGCSATIENK
jgi:hypothetical protein